MVFFYPISDKTKVNITDLAAEMENEKQCMKWTVSQFLFFCIGLVAFL